MGVLHIARSRSRADAYIRQWIDCHCLAIDLCLLWWALRLSTAVRPAICGKLRAVSKIPNLVARVETQETLCQVQQGDLFVVV